DDLSAAKAITSDTARGIRNYFWSYRPDTLLYLRDNGGDENFHLYAIDLDSGESRDLSPFDATTARVSGLSHRHPDTVLVGMNDRDPKWHDLYSVDLASGERTLVETNSHEIAGYVVDGDYALRYATRANAEGGQDLLRRAGDAWEQYDTIPYEDGNSGLGALRGDGGALDMLDSRGRDTSALFAIDPASGEKTLLHEDARADVGGSITDPRTGKVQAVSVNYLREEWATLDESIQADLDTLKAIGPGEASINTRTLDDRTWIVAYSAA